jgi:hypothetical protein
MTKTKRNTDNDNTRPAKPSPNPKAKKKNKEDPLEESSREGEVEETEETKNEENTARNLSSRFNEEIDVETVSGTPQLWTQSILYPTPNWKQVKTDGLTGFSSDELFGEGDTVHNLARLGKIIRGLDTRSSLTADGWSALFQEAFTQPTLDHHKHILRLQTFGIRLALSTPTTIFQERTAWIGSALRAREDTNAWTGAYLFFGAPWNTTRIKHFNLLKQPDIPTIEDDPPPGSATAPMSLAADTGSESSQEPPSGDEVTTEPAKDEDMLSLDATEESEDDDVPQPVKPKKSRGVNVVSFPSDDEDMLDDPKPLEVIEESEAEDDEPQPVKPRKSVGAKAVSFQTRNYFLSKPKALPKAQPKNLSKALERKFNTFFKVRLPKMQTQDMGEQEAEVIQHFQKLTSLLWDIDPQILIYPWIDNPANKPLKKGGKLPIHRDGLKVYADNIYLAQYKSPWLKLRIGHSKDYEVFADETFKATLLSSDMTFYKEKLQTRFTCRTGWLLGTHSIAFNARNLEAAIEQLPEFKNIPIECRMEPIRTARNSSAKGTKKVLPKDMPKPNRAAHIWTSWERSGACRKAMSDLYSHRNTEGFPLGIQARFVPYTMDSRFITTPKTAQNVERMKSKQQRFNDKTQTARNFTIIGLDYMCPDLDVTLREVIMGLRSSSEPDRNLFVAVDQMSNYTSVILAFHEDFEQEALTAIPALPIILEAKLGPHVWQWFNEDARDYAVGYHWDKDRGLVSAEDERTDAILDEWGSDNDDLDSDDDAPQQPSRIEVAAFGLVLATPGRNQYNDNYSVGTFKTACDPRTKTHARSNQATTEIMAASTTPSDVETSLTSPSTSTLSTNESSREETFNQWCQDEQFRTQAMEWLVKNLQPKSSLHPTTAEDNTGGEHDE